MSKPKPQYVLWGRQVPRPEFSAITRGGLAFVRSEKSYHQQFGGRWVDLEIRKGDAPRPQVAVSQ